jgi:hypothetical protein
MRPINSFLLAVCIALAIALVVLTVTPFYGAPYNQAASAAADSSQNQQSYVAAFWKWTTHDPVAFYTSLLAVFTFVLAVSTIGLWIVTYLTLRHARQDAARQARDMRDSIKVGQDSSKAAAKSADAAERGVIAADRAWIEVVIKLTDGLTFDKAEIYVSAEATFKNVGRSPATDVGVWLRLCADAAVASHFVADDARIGQRGYIRAVTGSYGQVLFPGRDASTNSRISIKLSEFTERL